MIVRGGGERASRGRKSSALLSRRDNVVAFPVIRPVCLCQDSARRAPAAAAGATVWDHRVASRTDAPPPLKDGFDLSVPRQVPGLRSRAAPVVQLSRAPAPAAGRRLQRTRHCETRVPGTTAFHGTPIGFVSGL